MLSLKPIRELLFDLSQNTSKSYDAVRGVMLVHLLFRWSIQVNSNIWIPQDCVLAASSIVQPPQQVYHSDKRYSTTRKTWNLACSSAESFQVHSKLKDCTSLQREAMKLHAPMLEIPESEYSAQLNPPLKKLPPVAQRHLNQEEDDGGDLHIRHCNSEPSIRIWIKSFLSDRQITPLNTNSVKTNTVVSLHSNGEVLIRHQAFV